MQKQAILINIKEGGIGLSPWHIDWTELTLRLALAVIFGGAIGLEREKSNRAAGFRTNILVCLGSALIMLLSIYGFSAFSKEPSVRLDPARLAAQVVSGIGFLGAGVILFNGFSITGLTTAATLWVVAAIGLAVGAGFYYPALFTTILVLFSLLILNKIERNWIKARRAYRLELISEPGSDILSSAMNELEKSGVDLLHLSYKHSVPKSAQKPAASRLYVNIKLPKKMKIQTVIEHLKNVEGVAEIRVE